MIPPMQDCWQLFLTEKKSIFRNLYALLMNFYGLSADFITRKKNEPHLHAFLPVFLEMFTFAKLYIYFSLSQLCLISQLCEPSNQKMMT